MSEMLSKHIKGLHLHIVEVDDSIQTWLEVSVTSVEPRGGGVSEGWGLLLKPALTR